MTEEQLVAEAAPEVAAGPPAEQEVAGGPGKPAKLRQERRELLRDMMGHYETQLDPKAKRDIKDAELDAILDDYADDDRTMLRDMMQHYETQLDSKAKRDIGDDEIDPILDSYGLPTGQVASDEATVRQQMADSTTEAADAGIQLTPAQPSDPQLTYDVEKALGQLPAAPDNIFMAMQDGTFQDADHRSMLPDGYEPVDVTAVKDKLPADAKIYTIKGGDPNQYFFARKLSRTVAGEDHEQTQTEAFNRSMGQQLVSALHGAVGVAQSAWGELASAELVQQRAEAGQGFRANTAEEEQAVRSTALTEEVERLGAQIPLSDYYARQRFSVYQPQTWAKGAGSAAGMALPMILSALVPQSRLGGAVQKVMAVTFDAQMVDESFQRAKEAGLEPGTPEYDQFALVDGTATMLVFKLGGAGLSAAGQKLLKAGMVKNALEAIRERGGRLTEAALNDAFAQAARRMAPVLKASLKEGVKMGSLGAAMEVKDEATGRLANLALSKKAFAEHTLSQLGERALDRSVELGTVGALSGAAAGVGQARSAAKAERANSPQGLFERAIQPGVDVALDGHPYRVAKVVGNKVTLESQGEDVLRTFTAKKSDLRPLATQAEGTTPPPVEQPAAEAATGADQDAGKPVERGEKVTFKGREANVTEVRREKDGTLKSLQLEGGQAITKKTSRGRKLLADLDAREAATPTPTEDATQPTSQQTGDQAGGAGHAEGPEAGAQQEQGQEASAGPGEAAAAEPAAEPAGGSPDAGDAADRPEPGADGGAAPALRPVALREADRATLRDLGNQNADDVQVTEVTDSPEHRRRLPVDTPAGGRLIAAADGAGLVHLDERGDVRLATARTGAEAGQGDVYAALLAAMQQGGRRVVVASEGRAQFLRNLGFEVEVAGAAPAGDVRQAPQGSSKYPLPAAPAPTTASAGRIQPAPITGKGSKRLSEIFLDLRKELGGTIFFSKGKGQGSQFLGAHYDPGTRSIGLRSQDPATAAHEIGHALDDRFGLISAAPPAAVQEIQALAQHGSPAPKGHHNPVNYATGEAVAEYIRARLLNPDQAKADFPLFTQHFDATVPAKAEAAINRFGEEIRKHAGDPKADNIQWQAPEKQPWFAEYRKRATAGSPLTWTWKDTISQRFFNDYHLLGKAWDYLRQVSNTLTPTPEKDAMLRARLLNGQQGKLQDQILNGLTPFAEDFYTDASGNVQVKRLTDLHTGEVISMPWLLRPFAGETKADVEARQQAAGMRMVDQRTIAEYENRIGNRVRAVLERGGVVDDALLMQQFPSQGRRMVRVKDASGKRVELTMADANAHNRQALAGKSAALGARRQGREQKVNAGIDAQVTRWNDYLVRAEQAIQDELSDRATRNQQQADRHLAGPAGDQRRADQRELWEVAGEIKAEEQAAGFSKHGQRVAAKVEKLLEKYAQDLANAKGDGQDALAEQSHEAYTKRLAAARQAAANKALARVRATIKARLAGLEKLRTTRLAGVNARLAPKENKLTRRQQPRSIDLAQGGPITGIGGVYSDVDKARQRMAEFEAEATKNPQWADDIEEGIRRYRVFADANLRRLVDSGRLSEEHYRNIKLNQREYVALQRVRQAAPGEDATGGSGGGGGLGSLGPGDPGVEGFQGSDADIQNPWVSLIDGTLNAIDASDRNQVLRQFRDLAQTGRQMNGPHVGGEEEGTGLVMRYVGESSNGSKFTKAIYVDGKAEYWQFDQEVFKAIEAIGKVEKLPKALEKLARVVSVGKALITHSPKFIARNVIRDTGEGLITSVNNQLLGFKTIWSKSARRQAAEGLDVFGGSQGGNYGRSTEDFHRQLGRMMDELATEPKSLVQRTVEAPRKIWDAYLRVAQESEQLGRRREYSAAFQQAKKGGMSDRDAAITAAFHARDLMDFSVAGEYTRALNRFVPFLNARVQGLRKIGRLAQSDPKGLAARFVAYGVLPALLEAQLVRLAGRQEDYDQQAAYKKALFYYVPMPGDKVMWIPKPFELGAAASLLQTLTAEYLGGRQNASEGMTAALRDASLPAEPESAAGPLRPVVEVLANYDFFRKRDIIPDREKDKDIEFRKGAGEASRLGQGLAALTGDNIDPRNVDYLVKGFGGGVGELATGLSNAGRGDGLGFGLNDTGFFGDLATGTRARDVQWIKEAFKRTGLPNSHRWVKKFSEDVGAVYDAKTPQAKQVAEARLLATAKRLRQQLDAEQLRAEGRRQMEKAAKKGK